MRKSLVLPLIGVAAMGVAGPAIAAPTDPTVGADPVCLVIAEDQFRAPGVTVSAGAQVCETHRLSMRGASLSASHDTRIGLDTDLGEILALLPRDTSADLAETYRHWMEDHLGADVYENTVCSSSTWDEGENYVTDYLVDEYAGDLDCYATDYLLGAYVRDAALEWVDRVVPGGIPGPARRLVERVIDDVVDVTNRPVGAPAPAVPPLPPVPAVPPVPGLTP